MKVLVVSNMGPSERFPNYGVFIKNFCDQLSNLNIDYKWIYVKKTSQRVKKYINYIIYFIKVFFLCIFGNYEYIYIHYLTLSSIPVIWANKIKKLNIIGNAHGSDLVPETSAQKKYSKKYLKQILPILEKVIVPSEYFKKYLINHYKNLLSTSNIIVSPSGGIDSAVFRVLSTEQKLESLEKLKLSSSKKYIGYCGRIEENKGINTLLEAYSSILNTVKNVDLIIVGTGNYQKNMESYIKENNLHNKVHLFPLKKQSELAEIYNILDFFIFPTEREGESLGLVALEAMACGTPVIASDFAAPKYYIVNSFNGYKFEKGNSVDLARVIVYALNHDSKHLIKNGLNTVKKYYSSEISSLYPTIFS